LSQDGVLDPSALVRGGAAPAPSPGQVPNCAGRSAPAGERPHTAVFSN